jgi:hypothetical protein
MYRKNKRIGEDMSLKDSIYNIDELLREVEKLSKENKILKSIIKIMEPKIGIVRIKVESSNIDSIGYDTKTSTLEIEFINGRVYQYFNVPYMTYLSLFVAKSKGKYFANYIKNNYEFEKVE